MQNHSKHFTNHRQPSTKPKAPMATAIESLEARIAPAAITINAALKTATWTDFDGDIVTLKYSTNAPTFSTTDQGMGLIVDKIGLTVADNNLESFTLKVKAGPLGNGHVDLGHIAGTGVPLKSWTSPTASVLDFDCGDGTTGIGSLVIGSLGVINLDKFNMSGASAVSDIMGKTGSALLRGDIDGTALRFTNPGPMKSLTVTGSLRGDHVPAVGLSSGILAASGTGSIQNLTIGGGIIGGEASGEGQLSVQLPVTNLTIKGSIIGGTAESAGAVFASGKVVKIGGNIFGGNQFATGVVALDGVKSLTIGGSLIGGEEAGAGNVGLSSSPGVTVVIKGGIKGGFETNATLLGRAGSFLAQDDVKSLTIGGDLVAGSYGAGTQLSYNGAVIVNGTIGTLKISGGIYGNNGTAAMILAKGSVPTKAGNYNAIGKLTVGVGVSYGYIATGHASDTATFADRIGNAENPDAGIGAVTVGGDWYHSTLTAGINDANSTGFSTGDTHSMGDADRQAVLGPVVIKGFITDNPAAAGFSGFGADKIASIIANGVKIFKSGDASRSLDVQNFVDVKEFSW